MGSPHTASWQEDRATDAASGKQPPLLTHCENHPTPIGELIDTLDEPYVRATDAGVTEGNRSGYRQESYLFRVHIARNILMRLQSTEYNLPPGSHHYKPDAKGFPLHPDIIFHTFAVRPPPH